MRTEGGEGEGGEGRKEAGERRKRGGGDLLCSPPTTQKYDVNKIRLLKMFKSHWTNLKRADARFGIILLAFENNYCDTMEKNSRGNVLM